MTADFHPVNEHCYLMEFASNTEPYIVRVYPRHPDQCPDSSLVESSFIEIPGAESVFNDVEIDGGKKLSAGSIEEFSAIGFDISGSPHAREAAIIVVSSLKPWADPNALAYDIFSDAMASDIAVTDIALCDSTLAMLVGFRVTGDLTVTMPGGQMISLAGFSGKTRRVLLLCKYTITTGPYVLTYDECVQVLAGADADFSDESVTFPPGDCSNVLLGITVTVRMTAKGASLRE